jgi:DNA adenine methylase
MKPALKTPISYYGGKQNLVKHIVPIIDKTPHDLYGEVFLGGAAIFFSKKPSKVEVINDTNKELMNFYYVAKTRFVELEKRVAVTLHSRWMHRDAVVIYESPHLFDEIERAWALWVLSSQTFCAMLDGSWGYDLSKNTTSKKIANKVAEFTIEIAQRLQNVQLESSDANYIIKSRDTAKSLFYCDPPYYNSNCGHYDGYSIEDYTGTLQTLSEIKGRFLLSSYPSDVLSEYTKQNGWKTKLFEQGVSVNAKGGYVKRKVEVLTANFNL